MTPYSNVVAPKKGKGGSSSIGGEFGEDGEEIVEEEDEEDKDDVTKDNMIKVGKFSNWYVLLFSW